MRPPTPVEVCGPLVQDWFLGALLGLALLVVLVWMTRQRPGGRG